MSLEKIKREYIIHMYLSLKKKLFGQQPRLDSLPGSRTQLSPSDSTHNISGSLKQGRVANLLAKVSDHYMETGNQKKRF